jgi:hypothetical protein
MSPALTTGRLGDRVICDPMAYSSRLGRPNSYVFNDTSDREGARLRLLASLLDPCTGPAWRAQTLVRGRAALRWERVREPLPGG